MLELLLGFGGLVGGWAASEALNRGAARLERELTSRLVKHFQDNHNLLRAPRRAHCVACLEILDIAKEDLANACAGHNSALYTGRFPEFFSACKYFKNNIRKCASEAGYNEQLEGKPAANWATLISSNTTLVEDALAEIADGGSTNSITTDLFADAAAFEIASAGWSGDIDTIANVLHPVCREQYPLIFAKAIAEEIKSDTKFNSLWLTLKQDEIRRSVAHATEMLEKVYRNQSRGPRLVIPLEAKSIFHYTSPTIEMIGRAEETKHLIEFLESDVNFCWMQLSGVGGQGKSRLALKLVLHAIRNNWAGGFLYDDELEDFTRTIKSWEPDHPHLIVLDYIIGRENAVAKLFRAFRENQNGYQFPVRLLLSERQRWDAGGRIRESEGVTKGNASSLGVESNQIRAAIEGLTTPSSRQTATPITERVTAEWFAKACGNTDVYTRDVLEMAHTRNLIELDRMANGELVWITRKVAFYFGQPNLKQSDRFISDQLNRLDSAGRPLFAYLLGLALSMTNAGSSWSNQEDLLNYVLRRDQRQRWGAYFGETAPAIGDDIPAMRLAVLATIVRGFDFRDHNLSSFISPINSDLRRQALALNAGLIASSERGPGNYLPPLEPDLIGEWFVLNAFEGGLPMAEILDLAWQIKPKETGAFLQRIAQDFPEHPTTIEIVNYRISDFPPKPLEAFAVQILCTLPTTSAPLDGGLIQSVRQLAKKGDADAEVAIARYLLNTIEADDEKGDELTPELLKFLESAVSRQHGDALSMYGVLLFYGRILPQNRERGVELVKAGANARSVPAMRNFAIMLRNGLGRAKDSELAAYWAKEAAQREDAIAMSLLGDMYLKGDGISKDLGKALLWLKRSSDAGNKDASKTLDGLHIARILHLGHDLIDSTAQDWASTQVKGLQADSSFIESPPIPGKWRTIFAKEAHSFLADIATSAHHQEQLSELFRLKCEAIRKTPLTCFHDCNLLEVQVRRNLESVSCSLMALQGPRGAVILDGSNTSIYNFAKYSLHLNGTEEANTYIRFFFSCVAGRHGRFDLLESKDNIRWTDVGVAEGDHKRLEQHLEQQVLSLSGSLQTEDGDIHYRGTASMAFKNSLFNCSISIDKDGFVVMSNEELVLENLRIMERNQKGMFLYPYQTHIQGLNQGKQVTSENIPKPLEDPQITAKKVKYVHLSFGRPTRPRNQPAEQWAIDQAANFASAQWIDQPIVKFDWQDITRTSKDFQSTLGKVHEAIIQQQVDIDMLAVHCNAIRATNLGFYPGTRLVEIQLSMKEEKITQAIISLMVSENGATILDGLSPIVYALNKENLSFPDETSRLQYLKFFSAYVRGEQGPFLVVEHANEVQFVDNAEQARLLPMIDPIKPIREKANESTQSFSTFVIYDGHLFRCLFNIGINGLIEMKEDYPVTDIAQVKRRRYRGPLRWVEIK
nr:tetratricopeptide repeat protein [uncultured Cohaesibacter sp.]